MSYTPARSQPSLRLDAISADAGGVPSGGQMISLDEFKSLAADPALLTPLDLSGYTQGAFHFTITNNGTVAFETPSGKVDDEAWPTNSIFNLNASFSLYSKQKLEYAENREWRLGVFFQPVQYQQSNYIRIDTIRQDSLVFHYAYYESFTPVLGLSSQYLWRTNPGKWWRLYVGFGGGVGCSIYPRVSENYGAFSDKITVDSALGYPIHSMELFENNLNTYSGTFSFILSAMIPVEAHFRMAGNLFLLFRAQPAAAVQIYAGGSSFATRPYVGLAGGLRWNITDPAAFSHGRFSSSSGNRGNTVCAAKGCCSPGYRMFL